jgi:hypothetical protein
MKFLNEWGWYVAMLAIGALVFLFSYALDNLNNKR